LQYRDDLLFAEPASLHSVRLLRVGLYSKSVTFQGSTSIQVQQFADNYLPNDVADNYVAFMRGQGFPARAVDKDLREVQGNLKLRHVRFGNKVTLSGPPQAFAEMVTMETVEADGGIVTRITIKGEIENPE
uniref:hypothetical protein n=1 Tax=Sphingopyxis sp. 2PD TaxID=2502196 RepID=UPI001BB15BB2